MTVTEWPPGDDEKAVGASIYEAIQAIGRANAALHGAYAFTMVLDWPAYWALIVHLGNSVSFEMDQEDAPPPAFIRVGDGDHALRVVWPPQPEYVAVWTPGGLCRVYEGKRPPIGARWALERSGVGR